MKHLKCSFKMSIVCPPPTPGILILGEVPGETPRQQGGGNRMRHQGKTNSKKYWVPGVEKEVQILLSPLPSSSLSSLSSSSQLTFLEILLHLHIPSNPHPPKGVLCYYNAPHCTDDKIEAQKES